MKDQPAGAEKPPTEGEESVKEAKAEASPREKELLRVNEKLSESVATLNVS